MVIATRSALPEASSEVKERVLEEMVNMAVDGDEPASRVVDKKKVVVVKEADSLEAVSKDKALKQPSSSDIADGASKVSPKAVDGESYSYAFSQIKPMAKSAAEIWSHYKPSPKHDKIVETSPDVFDSLPEFFSSRFK